MMDFFIKQKRLSKLTGLLCIFILLLSTTIGYAGALTSGEAPGAPGSPSWWAPTTNYFVGTANNSTSKVYFTGFQGIIGAVFWPTPDTPNTTDLQFMVGDAAHTWVDEEKVDTDHVVTLVDPKALIWKVTNTDKDGKYKIEKIIYTDPTRDSLIQEVTFTALTGTVGDYLVYVLYNPTISNSGDNDTGQTVVVNGKTYLQASDPNGRTSVLGPSIPFQSGMQSNGFVGVSDGWTDLKGGTTPDYTMNWTYDSATNGNVAQMALLDLGDPATTSVSFKVVLGFGATATDAQNATIGTLGSDFTTLKSTYIQEWNNWCNSLDSLGGTANQQYYVAAMVIRASKDKASGAIVAGLGNPWGDTQGDSSNGGYHLVWARDLYKKASALLAAGDTTTATEAVDWLFTKQQKSDGSFPQNSWVDGTPYWTGQQLDQTAFPIMLAYKVGKTDATFYLNEIKPAADYLLKYAPYTGQERWEENSGYSPATIAAVVAGLVAAGKIADLNAYTADRDRYYERADYLQGLVANWTFTTSGPLGDGWYFERIDDWGDPNDGHTINIANGGGSWDERSIVDTSFTELVRHGVKPYNDPYIQQSFAETDGAIKQTILGKGDYWFRYPHDGYGENVDGSNYDGAGIGRLWPIFTGERGHYVIASGGDATPYLDAMRNAANSGYMIPEQVWDLNAPVGYTPGTPTKSMTPLGWSMAEYVTLAISKYYGKIADQLDIVRDRYITYAFQPDPLKIVDWDPAKAVQGKALTIYYNGSLKNSAQVIMHWGINNWATGTITDKKMIKRSDGIWEVTISVPTDATQIDMAFTDGSSWDNNGGADYHITITARTYTPYTTPVDLFPNPPVKGQRVTVYYKGFLASNSRSITLHYGFDGWANGTIADAPMTKRADGFWEVTLTMPANRYKFDFCFVNNAGTWDNNGGADWHYGVTQK